jgi:hypothetical protein
VSSSAWASPTKGECVDADTRGQALRKQSAFRDAREQLRTCTDPHCPRMVQSDCASRLEEIERLMPSVVLHARDETGEVTSVNVTMDGTILTSTLTGQPIEVDPGEHTFIFKLKDHKDAPVHATIDEGDKQHAISVTLEPPPKPREPPRFLTPLRIAGIATTAVGVVGIGLGAVFGLVAIGAWSSVQSECLNATVCDLSKARPDRDTAIGFATASDVGFIAGGILALAGTIMIALPTRFGDVHLSPMVGRSFGLTLGKEF